MLRQIKIKRRFEQAIGAPGGVTVDRAAVSKWWRWLLPARRPAVRLYLQFATHVGDASINRACSLPEARFVEFLAIRGTHITDAGMAHIGRLTSLSLLDVGQSQIGDTGLFFVTSLTRLQSLLVDRTNITDDGLRHLASLTRLRTLSFSSPPMTLAGLRALYGLPRLDCLWIVGDGMDDAAFDELKSVWRSLLIRIEGKPITYAASAK